MGIPHSDPFGSAFRICLVERSPMFSNPTPDDWLDARLRDVAVPERFARRLERAVWSDDVLDAALREVASPPSLEERLVRIPLESEDSLDALLREVPLPWQLPRRLQRVASPRIAWRQWREMAWAALMVVAAALLYAGATAGLFMSVAPRVPPERFLSHEAITLQVPHAELETAPIEGLDEASARHSLLASSAEALSGVLPTLPAPEWRNLPGEDLPSAKRSPDPSLPWIHGDFSQADPFLDMTQARWGPVFGVHRAFDELPELDKVVGLRPRGIDPPLVPGFDWATYRLFGVFPFASPSSPGLQKSVVPLDVRPTTFETLERYVSDGMLPPAGSLRTEEMLAAIDYGFPSPEKGAIRLHIAAGPSLFGGEGVQLLQVGIQSQRLPAGDRPPMRFTVALDVSASMNWGGRLDMVRQALTRFVPQLRSEDRISVVVFAERARVLAEDLAPSDDAALHRVLDALEARGATSLGEGLRTAYALAEGEGDFQGDRRVVLFTDGLTDLDRGTADRIEQQLADAAARNVLLEVIDLAQERTDSPQLTALACSGDGVIHRAGSREEVMWALAEIATGKPQVVAQRVRLEITFQPGAVQRYRLFGHEANPAADLMPSRLECDFRSGQSATALYELQFNAKGGDDVAVVDLSWVDLQGHRQRLVERVRKGQFAPTLVDAPLSLQMATVAAESAEVLRESPFSVYPASEPLEWVLQVGMHLDSRVNENASFVRFLHAVEQAAQARPYRRSVRH